MTCSVGEGGTADTVENAGEGFGGDSGVALSEICDGDGAN